MTTRRGDIIGSVRAAASSDATPRRQPSPVVRSPAWMRSTLKARSPSSTSPSNSCRQRRLLDVVFALQQIDADRAAGRDLLADGGGRVDRHGVTSSERLEDRADDRPRELGAHAIERVGVLPKNAAGSSDVASALRLVFLRGRRRLGFSQSTLFSRTSRSSTRAVIVSV